MGEYYKDSMVIVNILVKLPEEHDIFSIFWEDCETVKRSWWNNPKDPPIEPWFEFWKILVRIETSTTCLEW